MKKTLGIVCIAILLTAAPAWAKIGGGDITFTVKGAAYVVYSHDLHVGKLGLKCKECHYAVFPMQVSERKMTMAEMQNGQACGSCHNGKRAFDVKGNCDKCHKQ